MSSILSSQYSFWVSSAAVAVMNIALVIYGAVLTTKEPSVNSHRPESPSILASAKLALQTHLVFDLLTRRDAPAAKPDIRV